MKEKKKIEKAKKFLSQEPIINCYQLARVDEERSDIFLDEEEDPQGVLILSNETATMRGMKGAIKNLISDHLEKNKKYRFHAIDPQSFKPVKDSIDVEEDRETWLLIRLYEEVKEPESEVVPLEEEDAPEINEYWGLGSDDSTDYIKRRIKEGPAYGIRKDGELAAWSLTHFITDEVIVLGMLHVKEHWRRRGLAKDITEVMCKKGEERGLIPAVQIFKDNEPSLSLAEDLGFEMRGEHHWFDGTRR